MINKTIICKISWLLINFTLELSRVIINKIILYEK